MGQLRRLRGPEAEDYARDLCAILAASRLNQQYPDPEAIAAWIQCMRPACHRDVLPGLEVDLRTGMPSRGMWRRLQADRALAPASLKVLRPRAELEERARRYPRGPYQDHLRRQAYFTALTGLPPFPLEGRRAALRRLGQDERHTFQVVSDGLSAEGLPVRLGLLVQAEPAARRRAEPPVSFRDETTTLSPAFEGLLGELLDADAELAFARLLALPGLRPLEVQRASLGPVYVQGLRAEGPAAEAGRAFVGTFGFELADLEGKDQDNDPLSPLRAGPRPAADARCCQQARHEADLRVFRDRKLVVPAGLKARVQAWCQERGTRNVVHVAHPPGPEAR